MKIVSNMMPDMANADVGLVLMSEWIADEQDLIRALDLSMDEVKNPEWPDGLVSYSCFISLDRCRSLHYVQWINQAFHMQYVQNHLTQRLEKMEGKINIKEEKSHGRFMVENSRKVNENLDPAVILIGSDEKVITSGIRPGLVFVHHHTNIDAGNTLIVFELCELIDEQLSGLRSKSFSLYRSYVHK